ncbi:hypothetical protein MKX03_012215 [Papaver bracteatum]|nr:hypothetical protein MKX03_012215 [Papaver bracteatum]
MNHLLLQVCGLCVIFMVAPTNNMSRSETITHLSDGNTSSSYNLMPFADSGAVASPWDYCLPQEQDIPPGAVSWDCLACMETLTGAIPWFRADKRDIKFPQDRTQPHSQNGSSIVCPGDVYWVCAVVILCSYIFW